MDRSAVGSTERAKEDNPTHVTWQALRETPAMYESATVVYRLVHTQDHAGGEDAVHSDCPRGDLGLLGKEIDPVHFIEFASGGNIAVGTKVGGEWIWGDQSIHVEGSRPRVLRALADVAKRLQGVCD